MHGTSFPQSLVQRLDVDTAGYEVGQQEEEVKTVETWESEGENKNESRGNILSHMNYADFSEPIPTSFKD